MNGYVYILINDAMPGLTKIGFTDRHPKERASELSNTTGIPIAFTMHAWWEIDGIEARQVEQRIHKHLDTYRYSKSREFFSLSAEKAQVQVEILLEEWSLNNSARKFHLYDVQKAVAAKRAEQEIIRSRAAEDAHAEEIRRQAKVIRDWNVSDSKRAMEEAQAEATKKIGRHNLSVYSRVALLTVISMGVGSLLLPTTVRNVNRRNDQIRRQVLDKYRSSRTSYFKSHDFDGIPIGAINHAENNELQ